MAGKKTKGFGSIVQLEKDKTKARCRKWQLRVSTGKDRRTGKYVTKARTVNGTLSDAKAALRDFIEELEGRSAATAQRVGCLLQGARPDIADAVFVAREPRNVARFGQGPTLRSSSKGMVADAGLPWDPECLEETK